MAGQPQVKRQIKQKPLIWYGEHPRNDGHAPNAYPQLWSLQETRMTLKWSAMIEIARYAEPIDPQEVRGMGQRMDPSPMTGIRTRTIPKKYNETQAQLR